MAGPPDKMQYSLQEQMKDTRSSGSQKTKYPQNHPTPDQLESQSEGTGGTIHVKLMPETRRADERSILAVSAPNQPNSERIHSSTSTTNSPRSSPQGSQNQTRGIKPSKKRSSQVAHNGALKSPSQRQQRTRIILHRANKDSQLQSHPTALQQQNAPSCAKELDTLPQEPIQESTANILTGITTYGTAPDKERIISSPSTASSKNPSHFYPENPATNIELNFSTAKPPFRPKQNTDVVAKTKLTPIQMKGYPTCSFCEREFLEIDSFQHHLHTHTHGMRHGTPYRPGLGEYENYIQLVSFPEATAGRAYHHPHYLSYEQLPPQGIFGNAEQPPNLQGHFKHHETPVSDGVNDEDNDSLVYEAETQCALVKLTFFQSCQPCRTDKKDCNGESPCDKCTSFGEDCNYEIESEGKGREVEKRRFFEVCNRCEDIKAKRDGQKPCDGQYPCGSCIDLKTQCFYSIKPEIYIDRATENIALLSRPVKELATQRGLIAAILRPYTRVRRSITKCYGGISKALRYKKPKSRMD